MATKRVWAGSALSLIIFFFRAYASGNDTLSMDGQPSSAPSVTTKLTSAEKAYASGNDTLSMDGQPSSAPSVTTKLTSAEKAYASGNDTLSMDGQPSSAPSFTTKLTSAEKDGVKTTELGTTASPFDVQHTNEKTTDDKRDDSFIYDDKWDEPFKYDYTSLRQAGLTIATVLFLLGIMVITCGKMRCGRRCRMGKGRSYDVTRM
ncbi:FXYD domain containing ion transport regulator 5 isoform X2 [Ictalurus punctatus]|uniref:FXYD domain-containing ion transport regulator n=1 Tax=Ictalurus punctatus TaxID=7998 RepID=A0A2D0SVX8_ICTPU|nr:FXYD domain containing ion transport regulator 5 isoform X2 [Ictalurus punctatus]